MNRILCAPSVRGYTEICNMTFGKDHRTYDLALAILHEEIEHEAWFSEFIGEGPSGHALRKSGENYARSIGTSQERGAVVHSCGRSSGKFRVGEEIWPPYA